ncbi:MAG: glycoside hydrolase family 127 protein, partial [Bacteroides sp.]|nr:glycoside hydrolase family 127 protein [Bacteroides sp.]
NRFFYVNVLEADGEKTFNHGRAGRSPWFATACCPSNLARLIPQVSGMIYSHTEDDIFCALYASNSTELTLGNGSVKLKQQTDYPFNGKIQIEVSPDSEAMDFTLWLRIPTWCSDRFVPGELYSYSDKTSTQATASVNGQKVNAPVLDGYLPVKRSWKAGDKVELDLPMPIRYSIADNRVEADINRTCITRGPLVYCAEGPDNEHPASSYILASNNQQGQIDTFKEGILQGIPAITLNAEALKGEETTPASLKLIPYYAWNNRGDHVTMNVWFAQDAETAGIPEAAID